MSDPKPDHKEQEPTKEKSGSSAGSTYFDASPDAASRVTLQSGGGSAAGSNSVPGGDLSLVGEEETDLSASNSNAETKHEAKFADAAGAPSPSIRCTDDIKAQESAKLERLAQVVGDAHADEDTWLPAAEAAGGKDLSGAPSLAKLIMFRSAVVLGVVLSFFSIMACYVSSVFLASDVGWLGLKLHNDYFLNNLVGLDYMGWLVAGAGALFYWSSFFKYWARTIRYVAIALFIGMAYQTIESHFHLGLALDVASASIYLPFLFLLSWLGQATRDALPLHIGSKKLAKVLLPAVAFPGGAMLLTFWIISQPGYSQSWNYSAGTYTELAFNAFAVFLSTLVPGFVLARSINAKSPSGAATLSFLLQTPLLLGMILTIATCLLLGLAQQHGPSTQAFLSFLSNMGGGDWAGLGGTKALAISAALALGGVSAGLGGAAGAWCNNHFKDKKDEKPIEMG